MTNQENMSSSNQESARAVSFSLETVAWVLLFGAFIVAVLAAWEFAESGSRGWYYVAGAGAGFMIGLVMLALGKGLGIGCDAAT